MARNLDSFIGLVYDAAVDSSRWPDVLDRLSDLVGGASAMLSIQNAVTGRGGLISSRIPPEAERLYAEYYHARNVFLPCVAGLRPGTVARDRDLVSRETLVRTEFFNDFMRPFDLCAPVGVLLAKEPHFVAAAVCGRPLSKGEFDTQYLRTLQRVSPHLQRAMRISERLTEARLEQHSSAETLNRIQHGVLLVDEAMRIVFANHAAERLLDERDGMLSRRGFLHAGSSDESAGLRRLIVAATKRVRHGASGGTIRLTRTPPRRPLGALVVPLRPTVHWAALRTGLAMVLVSAPERTQALSGEYLSELYGLTPMEVAVALAVARGEGLNAVAKQLGVSLSTVKTHLQHVFEKTATSRQAELVRLLADSGPGFLP